MAWKVFDFFCTACPFEAKDELVSSEDVSSDGYPKVCPECGAALERKYPTPALRTSDSASFLDGTKRAGFAEGKVAAELECIKVNTKDSTDLSKIQTEIVKTGCSLT